MREDFALPRGGAGHDGQAGVQVLEDLVRDGQVATANGLSSNASPMSSLAMTSGSVCGATQSRNVTCAAAFGCTRESSASRNAPCGCPSSTTRLETSCVTKPQKRSSPRRAREFAKTRRTPAAIDRRSVALVRGFGCSGNELVITCGRRPPTKPGARGERVRGGRGVRQPVQ